MPITRSKQGWKVGELVNVGFVRDLQVLAVTPTPGDHLPDVYTLVDRKGKYYEFTPHHGLVNVTPESLRKPYSANLYPEHWETIVGLVSDKFNNCQVSSPGWRKCCDILTELRAQLPSNVFPSTYNE